MVKSLGDKNENETQIHAILEEFSLPYVFPKEVLKEAEKIKINYDKKDREDYKKELTFTIDPRSNISHQIIIINRYVFYPIVFF